MSNTAHLAFMFVTIVVMPFGVPAVAWMILCWVLYTWWEDSRAKR